MEQHSQFYSYQCCTLVRSSLLLLNLVASPPPHGKYCTENNNAFFAQIDVISNRKPRGVGVQFTSFLCWNKNISHVFSFLFALIMMGSPPLVPPQITADARYSICNPSPLRESRRLQRICDPGRTQRIRDPRRLQRICNQTRLQRMCDPWTTPTDLQLDTTPTGCTTPDNPNGSICSLPRLPGQSAALS